MGAENGKISTSVGQELKSVGVKDHQNEATQDFDSNTENKIGDLLNSPRMTTSKICDVCSIDCNVSVSSRSNPNKSPMYYNVVPKSFIDKVHTIEEFILRRVSTENIHLLLRGRGTLHKIKEKDVIDTRSMTITETPCARADFLIIQKCSPALERKELFTNKWLLQQLMEIVERINFGDKEKTVKSENTVLFKQSKIFNVGLKSFPLAIPMSKCWLFSSSPESNDIFWWPFIALNPFVLTIGLDRLVERLSPILGIEYCLTYLIYNLRHIFLYSMDTHAVFLNRLQFGLLIRASVVYEVKNPKTKKNHDQGKVLGDKEKLYRDYKESSSDDVFSFHRNVLKILKAQSASPSWGDTTYDMPLHYVDEKNPLSILVNVINLDFLLKPNLQTNQLLQELRTIIKSRFVEYKKLELSSKTHTDMPQKKQAYPEIHTNKHRNSSKRITTNPPLLLSGLELETRMVFYLSNIKISDPLEIKIIQDAIQVKQKIKHLDVTFPKCWVFRTTFCGMRIRMEGSNNEDGINDEDGSDDTGDFLKSSPPPMLIVNNFAQTLVLPFGISYFAPTTIIIEYVEIHLETGISEVSLIVENGSWSIWIVNFIKDKFFPWINHYEIDPDNNSRLKLIFIRWPEQTNGKTDQSPSNALSIIGSNKLEPNHQKKGTPNIQNILSAFNTIFKKRLEKEGRAEQVGSDTFIVFFKTILKQI